jgi:hypothetical protein
MKGVAWMEAVEKSSWALLIFHRSSARAAIKMFVTPRVFWFIGVTNH